MCGLVLAGAGIGAAGSSPSPEPSLPDASCRLQLLCNSFALTILYLYFFCFVFVFLLCICICWLCICICWFFFMNLYLPSAGIRFRFWVLRSGKQGRSAIRIRTFGNICIRDFTARDKSIDYRKIAALPRNQAHLHGYKCKMNTEYTKFVQIKRRKLVQIRSSGICLCGKRCKSKCTHLTTFIDRTFVIESTNRICIY